MDIGSRIKAARLAAGLSQEDLARRADMSIKGMSYIERGHIEDPHISSLRKIARALGMEVGELLSERELTGKAEASDEPGPGNLPLVKDTKAGPVRLTETGRAKFREALEEAMAALWSGQDPDEVADEHAKRMRELAKA